MPDAETRVFRPKSLGGLLRLYARNTDALLYAGGTDIISRRRRESPGVCALPPKVIYLGTVQELDRISRGPRHLDIGSGLSLSRVLSVGRNVLPRLLYEAILGIGTPPVRNLATLGGNVCAPSRQGDSLPALAVLEAQLELRGPGSGRWVSVERFLGSASQTALRPGEVLTRIRIPLEEWDFQLFRKIGQRQCRGGSLLSYAAAARFPKGVMELFRFCYGGCGAPVLRFPELEARLRHVHLPISPRLTESLSAELAELLGSRGDQAQEWSYRRATAVRLFRHTLERLNAGGMEVL
jgi:CO/xanthine dehydrogenase FAD-binding subunit